MADYFSFTIREAAKQHVNKVIISCFPGKLLKMAAGAECTHYRKSSIDLEFLADIAFTTGINKKTVKEITEANTVRHAFEFLSREKAKKICIALSNLVIDHIKVHTDNAVKAQVVISSFKNELLVASKAA